MCYRVHRVLSKTNKIQRSSVAVELTTDQIGASIATGSYKEVARVLF